MRRLFTARRGWLRTVSQALMRQRRRPSLAEMADPAYNPHLDRHETARRDAMHAYVAPIPSDDDLDGLVIDWDDKMRRRGR